MENVLLVVLLILALVLIGIVLLQRSEGGGLGIGGGNVGSARSSATALGKVTWIVGAAFLAISLGMTLLGVRNAADLSVADALLPPIAEDGEPELDTEGLLPPIADDEPLLPRADE